MLFNSQLDDKKYDKNGVMGPTPFTKFGVEALRWYKFALLSSGINFFEQSIR